MTTNLILAHRGLKTAKAAGECSMVGIRCRDSEICVAESGIRSRCAWLSLDWLNPRLGGSPKVGREDGLDNTLHRRISSKGLISGSATVNRGARVTSCVATISCGTIPTTHNMLAG